MTEILSLTRFLSPSQNLIILRNLHKKKTTPSLPLPYPQQLYQFKMAFGDRGGRGGGRGGPRGGGRGGAGGRGGFGGGRGGGAARGGGGGRG